MIDAIIVSGDIAQHGDHYEYSAASNFLKALCDELKNSFSRQPTVVVVPGNHDANRKAAKDHPPDTEEEFNAKFSAFHMFEKDFNIGHNPTFEQSCVWHKIQSPVYKGFSVHMLGINSAIRERPEPTRRYGWIDEKQLTDALQSFHKNRANPYDLRIAVFHHNPIFLESSFSHAIEWIIANQPAGVSDDYLRYSTRVGNYLRNGASVFQLLSKSGINLALHGHHHINSFQSYRAQASPAEPIHRSNVLILGAGSAGLGGASYHTGSGKEQPSATSLQLLSTRRIPWGWEIISHRLEISVSGKVRPVIQFHWGEPSTLHLPATGDDLEPILGVASSITSLLGKEKSNGDKQPNSWQKPEDHNFVEPTNPELFEYVKWVAQKNQNPVVDISWNHRPLPEPDEIKEDLHHLLLYGVRDWITAKNLYGDDLQLRAMAIDGKENKLCIDADFSHFSQRYIAGWRMGHPIFKNNESFYNKHRDDILRNLDYFGGRMMSTTVVVTTGESDKPEKIMFARRSRNVAVMPDTLHMFVAGALRPNIRKSLPITMQFDQDPHRSSLIPQAGSLNRNWETLVWREIERETSITRHECGEFSSFKPIALYIEPGHFDLVLLCWLHMSDLNFFNFENANMGRDGWETSDICSGKIEHDPSISCWENAVKIFNNARSGLDRMVMVPDAWLALYCWVKYFFGERKESSV